MGPVCPRNAVRLQDPVPKTIRYNKRIEWKDTEKIDSASNVVSSNKKLTIILRSFIHRTGREILRRALFGLQITMITNIPHLQQKIYQILMKIPV